MKIYLYISIFLLVSSCGGGSTTADPSEDNVDLIIEHPIYGNWVSSCVSSGLLDFGLDSIVDLPQYWINAELEVNADSVIYKLYLYHDANCELLSDDYPVSLPLVFGGEFVRLDSDISYGGYDYVTYITRSGSDENRLVSIAIIDNVPYFVEFDSDSLSEEGELHFVVLFEWFLERN